MTYAKLQYAKNLHKEKESITKKYGKAGATRKEVLRVTLDEVNKEMMSLHREINEWLASPKFDDPYYQQTKEFIKNYYITDKEPVYSSNELREIRRLFGEAE